MGFIKFLKFLITPFLFAIIMLANLSAKIRQKKKRIKNEATSRPFIEQP
jgi:hypothetical protein